MALDMFETMEGIRTEPALESLGLPLAGLARSSMLFHYDGVSCRTVHLFPWSQPAGILVE